MNLGELFVELGVVGDIQPLKDFVKTTSEAVAVIDKQIAKNKTLIQYKKDLAEATTEAQKKLIKENFASEIKKQKLVDEIDATKKTIAGKEEFAKGLGKVVTKTMAVVGALTTAALVINKYTKELVQSNQAMLNLTRTSDIALNSFQKWGNIGKIMGVDNAEQQLAGLNKRLFELQLTGEGARGFQLAGVNPMGQTAEGVLEQIRARIRGLNDTQASYLLEQIGLDPQMLHILRLSREEFEQLNDVVRRYRLTAGETKEIQQMNMQLQIAAIKLKYLRDKAVLAILPLWTQLTISTARIAEMFAKLAKKLGAFISKFRLAVGLAAVYVSRMKPVKDILNAIVIAMKASIREMPKLVQWVFKLGGAFARALLPLTAVFLILDDIATYFEGGDSLLGEVLNWSNERGGEISEAFKKIFGGDMFGGMGDLSTEVNKILLDILKEVETLVAVVSGAKVRGNIDFLQGLLNVKNVEDFNNLLKNAPQWIQDHTTPIVDNPSNFITPATQHNLSNNNTDNSQTNNNSVSMTAYIQTNQPAYDIQSDLRYAISALG